MGRLVDYMNLPGTDVYSAYRSSHRDTFWISNMIQTPNTTCIMGIKVEFDSCQPQSSGMYRLLHDTLFSFDHSYTHQEMNSEFPLLKLPLFGFEAVVMSLEIADLVHLSFTSKRLNRVIKALRLKMNRFMFIVKNDYTAIKFNHESLNSRGGWSLNHKNYPKYIPVTASIGGTEIRSYAQNDWLYSNTTGNVQENVKIQMDYLKELIRFPAPDISIHSDDLPDWKHPILAGFDECRELTIGGEKELKEEHMKEILQSCSVKERLYMIVPTSTTYTHDIFHFKLPKAVYIKRTAHWITSDVLFHSNCSHMLFSKCKLTARDFIQFVKRWLNSDDINFEFLYLSWENGVPQELNLHDLGVELNEFDPEKRSRCFPYIKNYAIDMSIGQDFIRKDGVLASIAIVRRILSFCVFHERFPNLDGRKVMTM
ncbi:unnamed protein product [Caenorhabditis brenneri]